MLNTVFEESKDLIIARIKSKANISKDGLDTQIEYRFYNVYSIVKSILRKKDDEYVSRYDEMQGMTGVDPISLKRIVDEVEFFKIK